MEPMPVQDTHDTTSAPPVSANGDTASPGAPLAAPPDAAPPPQGRHTFLWGLLRGFVLTVLLGGVILLFLVEALGVQMPWSRSDKEEKTVQQAAPLGVKLLTRYEVTDKVLDQLRADGVSPVVVKLLGKLKGEECKKTADFEDKLKEVLSKDERKKYQDQILARAIKDEHALEVPKDTLTGLGGYKGEKEKVEAVWKPKQGRPIELPGSLALDPTKVNRIRLRFAPATVMTIGQTSDPSGKTSLRELRSGDSVKKGEVLGVFYSVDVGNKKNDLFDAVMQYELGQQILNRYEANKESIP